MKKLINEAFKASQKAYAPYSNFKVGAALEAKNGRIFTGCNIENASYGLSMCSERTAIFKAISEGVNEFKRIAIYTGAKDLTTPCGACRQVLQEFCPNIEVILVNKEKRVKKMKLSKLLPKPFTFKK